MNLVDRYKAFRDSMSKEESWDWWLRNSGRRELGVFKINESSKKMSFRAADDTPSVAFYERLKYVDYGGDGESHDPVFRVQEMTGMSFQEAVRLVMSWEGLDDESSPAPTWEPHKEKKSEVKPYQPSYLRTMILNKSRYQEQYNSLVEGLFRGTCSEKEVKYAEKMLHIGYVPAEGEFVDRLFIPEIGLDGFAYGSYRYNRTGEPKGYLRKNAKRILFPEHMLPKYKKDFVVYCEGHTDVIVNVAKRIAAISTGSATKKFGKNIQKLAGKTLYDFPDLDFPGIKGAIERNAEIKEWNASCTESDRINHIIFWWADWFYSRKIYDKIVGKAVAKSDPFFEIANEIYLDHDRKLAFIDLKKIDKAMRILQRKKKVDPEKIFSVEENVRVIFKGSSYKEGFDFVDFYGLNPKKESDMNAKSTLISFLSTKASF